LRHAQQKTPAEQLQMQVRVQRLPKEPEVSRLRKKAFREVENAA
jgi:hypothetical protein